MGLATGGWQPGIILDLAGTSGCLCAWTCVRASAGAGVGAGARHFLFFYVLLAHLTEWDNPGLPGKPAFAMDERSRLPS